MSQQHPFENEPIVLATWHMGLHPKECLGKCQVSGAGGILLCSACGWDETYELLSSFKE